MMIYAARSAELKEFIDRKIYGAIDPIEAVASTLNLQIAAKPRARLVGDEVDDAACRIWARNPTGVRALRLTVSESFVFPEWLSAMSDAARVTLNRGDQTFWATYGGKLDRPAQPRADAAAGPALLCLPAPGVEMFPVDRARALARLANDRLAETISRSNRGHAGLATLSAFDPHAADEARRAVFHLGLAGLSLGANRGLRLNHPSLRPVFAFAVEAGVPIYLPAGYAPSAGDAPYRAVGSEGVIAGAARDSAHHAEQLIFGGVLDDFPTLQIVLARLGDATPYWYGQLASTYAALMQSGRPPPERTPASYFAETIRLTTADMTSHETRTFCAEVFGKGRILNSDAACPRLLA